jgi:very-short-patch-repair endonuclease
LPLKEYIRISPYRRFLDFHIFVGNTLVVIEVDEDQHKYYNKKDEELRTHEILHNIGLDKKMVFIRFNPSRYKCKGNQVDMDSRLAALVEKANEVIEYLESGEEYSDIHHEIKLFYDQSE